MWEGVKIFFKEILSESTLMALVSLIMYGIFAVTISGGYPTSKEGVFITCLLAFIILDTSSTNYEVSKILTYIEESEAEVNEIED